MSGACSRAVFGGFGAFSSFNFFAFFPFPFPDEAGCFPSAAFFFFGVSATPTAGFNAADAFAGVAGVTDAVSPPPDIKQNAHK